MRGLDKANRLAGQSLSLHQPHPTRMPAAEQRPVRSNVDIRALYPPEALEETPRKANILDSSFMPRAGILLRTRKDFACLSIVHAQKLLQ